MHDDRQAIALVGPVGSGKSSYAHRLADQRFLPIDCSAVLSEVLQNADPRDGEVQEQLERKRAGLLVETSFVVRCMAPRIIQAYEEGWSIVLPGSFRTLQECQLLWPILERTYGTGGFHLYVIHVSLQEVKKRCARRRVCQHGHSFGRDEGDHLITRCPKDGTEVTHRHDDDPDVVTRRYRVYEEAKRDVISFFYSRFGHIGHLPPESSEGHAKLRHLTGGRLLRSRAANV